jgi:hypothetical protein
VDTLTTMSTLSEKRPQLWVRCRGRCEVTGRPLDYDTFDMHHRRRKGMGGTSRPDRDNIENLLALDPDVHHIVVHGYPTYSMPRGYLISTNADWPGGYPVWLHRSRWVLLGADGDYWPLPSPLPAPDESQKARPGGMLIERLLGR